MNMFRGNIFGTLIEKKLSKIFGSAVTFGHLKISPLSGALEAERMQVGDMSGDRPPLKIGQIRAVLSIGKALAGQIAIKSLTIEEPVVTIVLQRDGKSNLPPFKLPSKGKSDAQVDSSGAQFSMNSLTIRGGQVHFHDETGGSNYHASAENISGECREEDGKTRFDFTAEFLGRRDVNVPLGPLSLSGSFAGAGDLAGLGSVPMEAELTAADRINLKTNLPAINERKGVAEIRARTNFKEIVALLPPRISLPGILKACEIQGEIETVGKLRFENASEIRIEEFRITAGKVNQSA